MKTKRRGKYEVPEIVSACVKPAGTVPGTFVVQLALRSYGGAWGRTWRSTACSRNRRARRTSTTAVGCAGGANGRSSC